VATKTLATTSDAHRIAIVAARINKYARPFLGFAAPVKARVKQPPNGDSTPAMSC